MCASVSPSDSIPNRVPVMSVQGKALGINPSEKGVFLSHIRVLHLPPPLQKGETEAQRRRCCRASIHISTVISFPLSPG